MEDEIKSISFKNVSFKYPGSDKYVLEDISFDIKGEENFYCRIKWSR